MTDARPARALVATMLAALLAISGFNANAMSIRELRGLEQVKPEGQVHAQYYLIGVMEGLREANDLSVRDGHKPWFCIAGRTLEPRMALSIYSAELQRNPDLYEADMPVQLVFANALRNGFRC